MGWSPIYPPPLPPPRRRRPNWWALAAGIFLFGYILVVAIVLGLWSMVGFYIPGPDVPHPTLFMRMPTLVGGATTALAPLVLLVVAALSIVGLVWRDLIRFPAIITLVVAGVGFLPACWEGVVGAGLFLFMTV